MKYKIKKEKQKCMLWTEAIMCTFYNLGISLPAAQGLKIREDGCLRKEQDLLFCY